MILPHLGAAAGIGWAAHGNVQNFCIESRLLAFVVTFLSVMLTIWMFNAFVLPGWRASMDYLRTPVLPRKHADVKPYRGIIKCGAQICPYQLEPHRCTIGDDVCVLGWPSRGGMIVLEHANVVDMEYLELDPLNPPLKRNLELEAEDDFCQRLLLLGAKWWDSEARFKQVHRLMNEDGDGASYEFYKYDLPLPTLRERRWVAVG